MLQARLVRGALSKGPQPQIGRNKQTTLSGTPILSSKNKQTSSEAKPWPCVLCPGIQEPYFVFPWVCVNSALKIGQNIRITLLSSILSFFEFVCVGSDTIYNSLFHRVHLLNRLKSLMSSNILTGFKYKTWVPLNATCTHLLLSSFSHTTLFLFCPWHKIVCLIKLQFSKFNQSISKIWWDFVDMV